MYDLRRSPRLLPAAALAALIIGGLMYLRWNLMQDPRGPVDIVEVVVVDQPGSVRVAIDSCLGDPKAETNYILGRTLYLKVHSTAPKDSQACLDNLVISAPVGDLDEVFDLTSGTSFPLTADASSPLDGSQ